MAQQTINVGTAPNDGTGDTLKTSFTKANANFTELYGLASAPSSLGFGPPQGRLTLAGANPIMAGNALAQTAISYAPYVGDMMPIFNGTLWVMKSIGNTFLTISTTDTTKNPSVIGVSKVNDWFVWDDGGTIRLGHGPDWTDDFTRSAGTALVRVNGILVNNTSITNGPAAQRGTYVGTTRSNASSQLEWIFGGTAAGGGAAWLGVWNAYNRVDVRTLVRDSTDSWSLAASAVRAANNSTSMRVSYVAGLPDEIYSAQYATTGGTSGSGFFSFGVAVNTATVFTGGQVGFANPTASGNNLPSFGTGIYNGQGFNFFQAMEAMTSSGTATFYGDAGAPTVAANGLTFMGRF